jgi:hypothetical protein
MEPMTPLIPIKAQIEPIIPPRENAAFWVDKADVVLNHPGNRVLVSIPHQTGPGVPIESGPPPTLQSEPLVDQ